LSANSFSHELTIGTKSFLLLSPCFAFTKVYRYSTCSVPSMNDPLNAACMSIAVESLDLSCFDWTLRVEEGEG
jgi:hypothetical protein